MVIERSIVPFVVVLVVGVCVAVLSYILLPRPLTGMTRAALICLRVAAVALLALALLEPRRVETREEPVRARVAVLVDRSQSMSIADEGASTRWDASEAAANQLSHALSSRFDVRRYTFDDALHPARESEEAAPDGRASDVLGAVQHALSDARGTPIAGVIVFTDGAQNVGYASEQTPSGAPVFPVGVGSQLAPKDIAVLNLSAPPVLFVDQEATLTATIRAEGYLDRPISVTLLQDNRPLVVETIRASTANRTPSVSFRVTPTREGGVRFTASVPAASEELTRDNNAKSVRARVLPAKIRVLLIDGTPRHEFAFLRRSLAAMAEVELTPLLIASPSVSRAADSAPARTGRYPLLDSAPSLPSNAAELSRYDVVIVGDVALYLLPRNQRDALESFLSTRGGGIAWLAGAQWLSRRLGAGAFESLLPVTVPTSGASIQTGEFAPELVADGRYHPATQFADTPEANDLLWRQMPLWSRLYAGLRPKPGSSVLVAANGGASPVVVFERNGAGKSLLIATDALWQWAFAAKQDGSVGAAATAYDRFWAQVVRWLATRSDVKQTALVLSRLQYEAGEIAEVAVITYRAGYQPASDAQVRVTVTEPSGDRAEVPMAPDRDRPSRFVGLLRLPKVGTYELRAEASSQGVSLGTDSASVDVETPQLEFASPARDDARLQTLADSTGGRYVLLNQTDEIAPLLEESTETRTLRVRRAAWDTPLLLIAVALALGAEWAIRKRKGLV